MTVRLLNLALRLSTLGFRFLLVFILARFLEPAEVGLYGLFTVTVQLALYLVGMDFYTYSSREVLSRPVGLRGGPVKAHAAVNALAYAGLGPVMLTLLLWMDWRAGLIVMFFVLLLLEHFNQEVSRLLVLLNDQLAASALLFLRQASWVLVLLTLLVGTPAARTLDSVLILWAAGGLVTAAVGIWRLRTMQLGGWIAPVDWAWVRAGLRLSMAFLMATLALRLVQTLDRYGVEALLGLEAVAAYVLFLSLASGLMVALDAAVFVHYYGAMITHHNRGETEELLRKVKSMLAQTVAVAVAFGAVSLSLLPYLLDWIGEPLYSQQIGLYPWLLTAVTLQAVSMVPHYALYARRHDRPIIGSHLGALAAFVLTTGASAPVIPDLAVPIGVNAAFGLILIWKTAAFILREKAEPPSSASL